MPASISAGSGIDAFAHNITDSRGIVNLGFFGAVNGDISAAVIQPRSFGLVTRLSLLRGTSSMKRLRWAVAALAALAIPAAGQSPAQLQPTQTNAAVLAGPTPPTTSGAANRRA